jgi:aminocarboxymuconate-semialdehyde decarboxylase
MGVDIQAVCPAPYQFFYFTEAGYGAELAQVNEGIAKVAADTPDRFVGLGSVRLQDAELAVRELDHAVKNLGLRGVEICTNVNGKNLTDPSLGWRSSSPRGTGHPDLHAPPGLDRGRPADRSLLQQSDRQPAGLHVAVSHLIFDGVMARHPKLKVLVAHGGGYIARFGADHVVLGTDYPYDMGDEDPLGMVAQVKRLPREQRDLVVGGNLPSC